MLMIMVMMMMMVMMMVLVMVITATTAMRMMLTLILTYNVCFGVDVAAGGWWCRVGAGFVGVGVCTGVNVGPGAGVACLLWWS